MLQGLTDLLFVYMSNAGLFRHYWNKYTPLFLIFFIKAFQLSKQHKLIAIADSESQ